MGIETSLRLAVLFSMMRGKCCLISSSLVYFFKSTACGAASPCQIVSSTVHHPPGRLPDEIGELGNLGFAGLNDPAEAILRAGFLGFYSFCSRLSSATTFGYDGLSSTLITP